MSRGSVEFRVRKALDERDYVLVDSIIREREEITDQEHEIWIRALYLIGSYEECIEQCDLATNKGGNRWNVEVFRARSYYSMGDIESSIDVYERLNKKFPNQSEPYIFLIRQLYNKGEFNESLRLTRGLLKEDSTNQEGLLFLGRILQQLSQIELAIEAFEKLLHEKPDHLDGNSRLGQLHYEKKDYKIAKEYLLRALEKDSGYRPARRLIGLCLDKLGESNDAIEWLLEEAEREPQILSNWEKIIDVYLKTSNEEKAKEVVEIASSKITDPMESLILFYSLSSSMGWDEGCEIAIGRLEEDYSDNFRHIQMMFEESIEKGNISSAQKYLDRMDNIGPTYEKLVIEYQNRFYRILEITGFSIEELNEKTKEIGEVHVSNLALDRISKICADLKPRKQNPKKRRILHVSSSMGRGGAERQLINCLRGFRTRKRSREIGLCTYANQGDESLLSEVIEMGVEIHEYGQNEDLDNKIREQGLEFISDLIKLLPQRFAQDFVQLVGIFNEKRPNIVNSWQDGTNIVAGYAALVSRVPTVLMFGRSMRPDSKTMAHIRNRPYLNGGYKCLLENSRFTLCLNSEQGRKSYAKWLGVEEEKLLILHNGLDLETMNENQNDVSVEEFLINAGVLPNSEVIGGVFRFVREKRLSLWVEAAFRVLEKRDGVFFIAVGDGPERKDIQRKVREFGFGDKILFPGRTNIVGSWLKKFDLFLLTSEIEGLPNVLIEAQGFGVPVLTTRAGGSEDTFENYDSGVLLIKSDADKIAKQIEICLDDTIWRERAKICAKEYASEKFSISGMINNLDLIYTTRMNEDRLEWNKEAGLKQKILSIIGVS